MQTIITDLVTTYGADPGSIWLAKPSYHYGDAGARAVEATYLPIIDELISENGLAGGPDFYAYYEYYALTQYDDGIHPNLVGFTNMARLYAISMMQPQNVSATQDAGEVTVSWDDLVIYEPSITRYYVKYGNAPGVYDTTIEVNGTSTTISGLTEGQTYYFVVSGHDNDPNLASPNQTRHSQEVSVKISSSTASDLELSGTAADQALRYTWTISGTLPAGSTWKLAYDGPTGDQASPITGIISPTRAYTLTGLTNDTWYTATLNAMLTGEAFLTDTLSLMPTDAPDHFVYLPLVLKAHDSP
jgi:hypothetical protein